MTYVQLPDISMNEFSMLSTVITEELLMKKDVRYVILLSLEKEAQTDPISSDLPWDFVKYRFNNCTVGTKLEIENVLIMLLCTRSEVKQRVVFYKKLPVYTKSCN